MEELTRWEVYQQMILIICVYSVGYLLSIIITMHVIKSIFKDRTFEMTFGLITMGISVVPVINLVALMLCMIWYYYRGRTRSRINWEDILD